MDLRVVGIVILLIAVGLSGCTETNKTTKIKFETAFVDRYPDIIKLNNNEFFIVLSMGLQYINGLIMAEDGTTYQHYFTIYNETGVRDPCIHKTDNGSLIVTYALSENNAGWLTSNDNGATWQHQGYISQGDIFSIDDIKTVNKNIYACGHSKGDRKCKFLIYDNNWKIINDSVLDNGNEWTFIPEISHPCEIFSTIFLWDCTYVCLISPLSFHIFTKDERFCINWL